jgi:hypothetical protein
MAACSAQTASGPSTPSGSASPAASASPSPQQPSPTSDEFAVPAQVLPPAGDMPAGKLCSTPITMTADGNATPLLCHDGAVNVQAWSFYADISQDILGLGLNPAPGQPVAAMCDDIAHNGATRAEEASGYRLAAAYYGWTFSIDPSKITCQ